MIDLNPVPSSTNEIRRPQVEFFVSLFGIALLSERIRATVARSSRRSSRRCSRAVHDQQISKPPAPHSAEICLPFGRLLSLAWGLSLAR